MGIKLYVRGWVFPLLANRIHPLPSSPCVLFLLSPFSPFVLLALPPLFPFSSFALPVRSVSSRLPLSSLVFCAPRFWATPEFKEFHFLLPSSLSPPRHTWHQDALREIVDESGARPLLLLKQDCEIISHGSGKIPNPVFPSAVTITMTHFFHNVHLAPKICEAPPLHQNWAGL